MKPEGLRYLIRMAESEDREVYETVVARIRYLAPLLLELWESAIRKAEDGPIGPPYDIDLALDALEEA